MFNFPIFPFRTVSHLTSKDKPSSVEHDLQFLKRINIVFHLGFEKVDAPSPEEERTWSSSIVHVLNQP